MDVADLGYRVDSSGVMKAAGDLNLMTQAAGKAETAVESLAGDARKADAALDNLGDEALSTAGAFDQMARAANDQPMMRYTNSVANVGKTAGVASHNLTNMVYQLNDVGVSLAGGMNPLMVFIQQGSQIGQIAASSGAGIGQWAKALGLLNPYILAAAAAAAIAAGAFLLFKSDVDKAANNDAFIKSLKLSKSELKELGDTSVSVGDVMKGFWRTVDPDGKVSKAFTDIKNAGVLTFRVILESVEWFVAGAFAGLNAVAKAMKGVAMVATGDMGGFNVFNHSLDGLVSDTVTAKKNMDAFWVSFKGNVVDVNRERVQGRANQIVKDRTAKETKDKKETDPKWMFSDYVKDQEDRYGAITKLAVGKDPWREIAVPSNVITSVDELGKYLKSIVKQYDALGEASRAFSQTVGDAFYDAATGAEGFFDSLTGGLARLAAQWAAADIEHILNKLFKVDDSATYQQNPLSGIGDGIASLFSGKSSAPSMDGGGYTGNGARSGGIDGKGGFWAVMHPQETVTDHTKGQSAPGGFDMGQAVATLASALTQHITKTSAAVSGRAVYKYDRALPTRLGSVARLGT